MDVHRITQHARGDSLGYLDLTSSSTCYIYLRASEDGTLYDGRMVVNL